MKVNRKYLAVLVFLFVASASWDVLAGGKKASPEGRASARPGATTSDSNMQLSGDELWSMNCARCHNMRSPAMYSDAQWDVIVHHMRVRANITGAEQRAIADFLKSASH